ncbi:MAG TPA: RNA polymerase sigma factor [Herbaspirillum sp.]|jgi:RNA polymerase sigma-70 factor (ECF subfamily)
MIANGSESASRPAQPLQQPLKIGGANWYASVEMRERRGAATQESSVDVAQKAVDDGSALQEVLTANYHQLHRRLTRYLGCPDLASDSLHDIWLRLASKERKEAAPAVQNPQAYLYRAARNAALDRLDVQKRHQGEADFDLRMEVTADAAPGPEAIAEACSDLRAMARVFERLPKLQLSVLYALRIDELPRKEVAQRYGISLRRVDRALAQALAYCAEQFQPNAQHACIGPAP